MIHNETFLQLSDLLVPARGEADTIQGEIVRALSRLCSEWLRNGNVNWEPHSQGRDAGHFQEEMWKLWGYLTDEPSGGLVRVFDSATLQQIQRDLGFLNLSAITGRILPVPHQVRAELLTAAHTGSEAAVWKRIGVYAKQWVAAHPTIQDEEVQREVGWFKEAATELHIEWRQHGNAHWNYEPDYHGGSAFYQSLVNSLWLNLFPTSHPLLVEAGFGAATREFEANHKLKNPFDESELEALSRDLVFINLLGYLRGFMKLESGQAASVLEAVEPKESEDVVFRRVQDAIIKWCRTNNKLVPRRIYDPDEEFLRTYSAPHFIEALRARKPKTLTVSREKQQSFSRILKKC